VKLSRANEGEVFRVEEEHDVFFADVLIERESFDDVLTDDSFCSILGGFS